MTNVISEMHVSNDLRNLMKIIALCDQVVNQLNQIHTKDNSMVHLEIHTLIERVRERSYLRHHPNNVCVCWHL